MGHGPEAGGRGGVAEAEGAGGQERLGRLLAGRTDKDFQRAALDFLRVGGVDELAAGQDQRTVGKNFGGPCVGESGVEGGAGHG